MRLFVALDVPETITGRVAEAVTPLRDRYPDATWTRSAAWHVTLAFLGEVDPGALTTVTDVVGAVTAEQPRVSLALTEAGRFGRRVAWLGVADDPPGEVALLGGRVQHALVAAGIAVDVKPVHPHVTLARARGRRGALPRDLVDDVPRVAGAWVAEEVVLYRSHLGGGPPRYEPLERFPLRPR